MRNLVLLLVFLPLLIWGQKNDSDSLWGLWVNEKESDSIRSHAILSLSRSFLFSDPDSAISLAKTKLNFDKLNLIESKTSREGNTFNIIGAAYYLKGNSTLSLKNYHKALKLSEDTKDSIGIANISGNIGAIFEKIDDSEEAFKKYHKSYNIFKGLKNLQGIATSALNLGALYQKNKKPELAKKYIAESVAIFEDIDYKYGLASSYTALAHLHFENNNYALALKEYQKGLVIAIEIKNPVNEIQCLTGLSNTYRSLKEYETAIEYGIKSYERSKEISSVIDLKADASQALYQAYKAIGSADNALKMFEEYTLFEDSLKSLKRQREILRQEYQYDIEKTEIELKRQREIDTLKTFQERLGIGILSLIFLLSILVYLRIRHIKNVNERKELIHQIELLKEKRITNTITDSISKDKLELNMSRIMSSIDVKLNESDQKILNELYHNPIITNKELADKVALSYEGASSSLRKMYRVFDISRTKNMKLDLIMKITHISDEV
ncbi:tetratricopeptide repeat protein [Vicingaceae bacterium]|nr:tetratricopeptide repeat protein [Vicingaceae bacterium]